MRPSRWLLTWLTLAGCGPEGIATSGEDETGGEASASAHWLLYTAEADGPSNTEIISLRAVDLGALDQGQIGAPVELLETTSPMIRWLGPTPWGGYALELEGVYMLVGLDEDGQIELYPGVPEGVPAEAHHPVFSADGRVAIFNGNSKLLPPDSFYWVRYEHGHPVEGRAIARMPSQLGNVAHVSPDGQTGIIRHRFEGTAEAVDVQLALEPEPGELVPLWEPSSDPPYVVALFDQHLFAWTEGMLHVGSKLVHVDMSSGVPGDLQVISPEFIFAGKYLYSATGDAVVWIDFEYLGDEDRGRLWRVDIVDGVPLPAVELTAPGELVHRSDVHLLPNRVVIWRPIASGQTWPGELRWVDLVDGQLGPIRTIAETGMTAIRWSHDGRWLSWLGSPAADEPAWRGVAALAGPGVVHHLDQLDASESAAWLGDRLLYNTSAATRLWSTVLGADGPSTSSALLGQTSSVAPLQPVTGHEAVTLKVDDELRVLRFDDGAPLDVLLVDDDPRRLSVVAEIIVREGDD